MKYAVLYLKAFERFTGMRSYECLDEFKTLPKAQDFMKKRYDEQMKSLCVSGLKHQGSISDNGYTIYLESGYGAVTNVDQVFIREIDE